ncbi:DnaJ C-terminal domain-containing protein [Caenimonas sp. SL110]|uniref:DnaJ C-terminal domain-containing protein n=1 Tax=Caenimonas sp. SL110 TaxID=1450524 RepID=UPI0006528834|nr:DnaJ C-terminal domain-containing protein [Caenimonas sp. SL110]
MKYKDYYAVLGVARDADADAIKKAYRKLAREHHPDVSKASGAEERFKDIGEAYATLKDPEKRAAYDQLGQREPGADFSPPPNWNGGGFDTHSFDDADLADLLASLGRRARGGHGGRGATHPQRGRDYETVVKLTLEQAHRGTTLNLDLAREEGGTSTLEVTVPAGVADGQRVRLRGKGGKGVHGGADGDIYLHIHLLPHRVFRVDGRDLQFDLMLAPWEAALGAEVEVPTLDGAVVLTVAAGTRAGRKLRLRGRGLADGKGGRGDLYAVAHIDVPATLTPAERDLFEQLAKVSTFHARAGSGKDNDKDTAHERASA